MQVLFTWAVHANNIKAPSNLILSVASSTQINLSWVDNSANELGTRIEQGPSSAGPWGEA